MSTQLETSSSAYAARTERTAAKKKPSYKGFLVAWTLLIGCGVMSAYLYTSHLKLQIEHDLARQTAEQLKTVQDDYQVQLGQMKESFSGEMKAMQAKVDALNELLAFAKDNANSKTDNTNQLYTQLQELQKKLDELKANMEQLK